MKRITSILFGLILIFTVGCSTHLCPKEDMIIPDIEFPGRTIMVPQGFFSRPGPYWTKEAFDKAIEKYDRENPQQKNKYQI